MGKSYQILCAIFWAQTVAIPRIYILPKIKNKIYTKLPQNPHFIYCLNYLTELSYYFYPT